MTQLELNIGPARERIMAHAKKAYDRRRSGKDSQRDRIFLKLFHAGTEGKRVPLYELMELAAQYNARIMELRREGFDIKNEHHDVNGVMHSEYWMEV